MVFIVEYQIALSFSITVVLANIVFFIKPIPNFGLSFCFKVSIFDLVKMSVNWHLVFEPMIKQMYFHSHL